jgi:hypothetical protein
LTEQPTARHVRLKHGRLVAELLAWIHRIEKRDAAPGNAYPPWGDSGTAPPAQNLEAPASVDATPVFAPSCGT